MQNVPSLVCLVRGELLLQCTMEYQSWPQYNSNCKNSMSSFVVWWPSLFFSFLFSLILFWPVHSIKSMTKSIRCVTNCQGLCTVPGTWSLPVDTNFGWIQQTSSYPHRWLFEALSSNYVQNRVSFVIIVTECLKKKCVNGIFTWVSMEFPSRIISELFAQKKEVFFRTFENLVNTAERTVRVS